MLDRDGLLAWLRDEIAANTEAMTSDSDTQADAAAMVVAWLSTLARGIEAGEFDVQEVSDG